MTQALQDVIRQVELEYAPGSVGTLIKYYTHLPPAKVSAYLETLRDVDQITGAFEGVSLEQHQVERGALIFLGALNILFAERYRQHDLPNIVEALAHIDGFESGILRQQALVGFLAVGLNLFRSYPARPEVLNEKVVVGEFHDRGGFQPGVWGVRLNLDLIAGVIEHFRLASAEKIEKLRQRYIPIRFDELVMLDQLAR